MDKIRGKIMQGVGGLYTVRITEDNSLNIPVGEAVCCRARGSFRHNHIVPLPGDNVFVCPADDTEKSTKTSSEAGFVIDEIVDRKNALIRPPLANLDFLFVTFAASSPQPVLTTIDKLISISEFNKIEPVIVVTKCELNKAYADELETIYKKSGFEVFKLSASESIGIEAVDAYIKKELNCGRIAAFAGASGVGKSTLLNKLFPNLELSTSEISRKIQRGRHTTRKVELYELNNSANCGYIADTPGFSMLDFERFDFFEKDDLVLTIREFADYIGKCRYTKCSHTKEEGCAICEAVKAGRIAKSRHESYCELYEILKNKKKW